MALLKQTFTNYREVKFCNFLSPAKKKITWDFHLILENK